MTRQQVQGLCSFHGKICLSRRCLAEWSLITLYLPLEAALVDLLKLCHMLMYSQRGLGASPCKHKLYIMKIKDDTAKPEAGGSSVASMHIFVSDIYESQGALLLSVSIYKITVVILMYKNVINVITLVNLERYFMIT